MARLIDHTLRYCLILCLLIALLTVPAPLRSDQAQYFYDELGRLIGVVDGSGNVAVYNYDEVGNLLSIDQFTAGPTGIGIFLLAPSSSKVDDEVQIQGFGFSPNPTDNQVAFSGTAATVVSSTATTIVATVPAGATTGPVTVTNTNGTAASPKDFVVLVPPIVVGVEPDVIAQGTTSQVLIEGFNLADVTNVAFTEAGLTATMLGGATEDNLPISLSVSGAVPPGSYTFSVTSPGGTAQSGDVTVIVTAAVPSFGMHQGSAFLPFPDQTPPSGPVTTVGPAVSVQMP